MEGKYNIKAVSALTGIQPGTLRAWERRYAILEPVRNEAGHRLYTDEHVKKLQWLTGKVEQGFTIGQAAALLESQEAIQPDEPLSQSAGIDALREELMAALLRFDETKAQALINKAFAVYTIDAVTIDLLASILVRIGTMWEDGEITTAHEHFATSILRSRIGMVMHSFPHNGFLPKVVAVCGPGEWHEMGLLIFTLFIRRLGYEVVYLGASLKEGDIQDVLTVVKPSFLFMSCTMNGNLNATLQLADELKRTFDHLEIGIGGAAMNGESLPEAAEGYVVGNSQQEWQNWLKERM